MPVLSRLGVPRHVRSTTLPALARLANWKVASGPCSSESVKLAKCTTKRLQFQYRIFITCTARPRLPRLPSLVALDPPLAPLVTSTTTAHLRPLTNALAMTGTQQRRSHAGHSHSHHHHHDNTYLTSSNRKDAGVRVTRLGLFVNVAMAVAKFIGGYYFNSKALLADAIHALTDMISDVMTLATVSWSLKPPTARFPSGYGKIESLGSLGVSSLLLTGGIYMGLNACDTLYMQFIADHGQHLFPWLEHGHGHSHSHTTMDLGPNINAAWLAGGSIVVKEYLYRATMKIAKERKSSVLASNAIHHRVDSLTSFVALLTIGGARLFQNAAWLDPVGGLIISAMVIRAGWGNTGAALLELADAGIDDEMKTSILLAGVKSLRPDPAAGIPGVAGGEEVEVIGVQGVKSGQNYLIEIEVSVPSDWSMERVRGVEDVLRERVGSKVRGVRRVRVRFVPRGRESSDFKDEFIGMDVSQRSSPEPEAEEHDHHDGPRHSHTNGSQKKNH